MVKAKRRAREMVVTTHLVLEQVQSGGASFNLRMLHNFKSE